MKDDSDLFKDLYRLFLLQFFRKQIIECRETEGAEIALQLLFLDHFEYYGRWSVKRFTLQKNIEEKIDITKNGFQRYFS